MITIDAKTARDLQDSMLKLQAVMPSVDESPWIEMLTRMQAKIVPALINFGEEVLSQFVQAMETAGLSEDMIMRVLVALIFGKSAMKMSVQELIEKFGDIIPARKDLDEAFRQANGA